jgi:hypothetical protein
MSDTVERAHRRRRGNVLLRETIVGISRSLGMIVNAKQFLELDQTDALRVRFQALTQGRIRNELVLSEANLETVSTQLTRFLSDHQVFMFAKNFGFCGALQTRLHTILRRLPTMARNERVEVMSGDGTQGFVCERLQTEAFTLRVWGVNWVNAVSISNS